MFFSHSNEPIVSPGQSEGPVKIGGRFKFKIQQKNYKTFLECNVRYHLNYLHSNMNINNHELTLKKKCEKNSLYGLTSGAQNVRNGSAMGIAN